MEYPPLVTTTDLPTGAGAPTAADLEAMSDSIRQYCGWHIAPVVHETITLDSNGAATLVLPTLRLQDVLGVRFWNGTTMVPLTGWDARTGWSEQTSAIHYHGGFPEGRRRLEVDVVHGYTRTPPSLVAGLLRLLVGPGAADVASEALPGHSITYRGLTNYTQTAGLLASSGALHHYRLGPRP